MTSKTPISLQQLPPSPGLLRWRAAVAAGTARPLGQGQGVLRTYPTERSAAAAGAKAANALCAGEGLPAPDQPGRWVAVARLRRDQDWLVNHVTEQGALALLPGEKAPWQD